MRTEVNFVETKRFKTTIGEVPFGFWYRVPDSPFTLYAASLRTRRGAIDFYTDGSMVEIDKIREELPCYILSDDEVSLIFNVKV